MSATTMNNTTTSTTVTNALLLKAAFLIAEKNPEVNTEQAIAMAKEMAKTPLFSQLVESDRNTDQTTTTKKTKTKKIKKDGPKRAKNAYMFYLAEHRSDFSSEILAAVESLKASPENDGAQTESATGAEDVKELLSNNSLPETKDGEEMKIPVKLVTKLAGIRWKKLSEEEQAPFKKLAEQDSADKRAEYEASKANNVTEDNA